MIARHQILREWQIFLLAVGFLTRIPVPADPDFSDEKLNGASRYFPLVGALIAAISALSFLVASALFDNVLIAVLLSMVASILVTGAFHLRLFQRNRLSRRDPSAHHQRPVS